MREMIRPAKGRVVCVVLPNSERIGNIYTPQGYRDGSTGHGEVIASTVTAYKVGDHVCWEFGAGYKHTLDWDGEAVQVIVLKAEEICGLIVKEADYASQK